MTRLMSAVVLGLCAVAMMVAWSARAEASTCLTAGHPGTLAATAQPSATPSVASVTAQLDPSLAAAEAADPYRSLNAYIRQAYHPNAALYDCLYHAVDRLRARVSISAYRLSLAQKIATCESLAGEQQYRFFYLRSMRISSDGRYALFSYRGTVSQIARGKLALCADLSHLLYDIAPSDYSPLQRLLSVYDFLRQSSSYSYSSNPATWSPAAILLHHEGICNGFANLLHYVLAHRGVPTIYVQNQAHAWDIVRLSGHYYHSDLTFGLGPSSFAGLRNVLMDDKQRNASLRRAGIATGGVIVGYPRTHPTRPPACTDTSFSRYCSIAYYALDLQHGKVFYSTPSGIFSMTLACGDVQLLTSMVSYTMVCYDGALYFINNADGFLYELTPGSAPQLLDGSAPLSYLQLKGEVLCYGPNANGVGCTRLCLSGFDQAALQAQSPVSLGGATVPGGRSFCLRIAFSDAMDATADWQRLVFLADSKGQPLSVHLAWSSDGRTLTVRSLACLNTAQVVTLYVASGAPAVGGETSSQVFSYRVTVG